MNTYVEKIDRTRNVPENYKKSPLPIVEKSKVILIDSKAERWMEVTVEPGVPSVRLLPPEKVACPSTRYAFAYTVNRYVGERAEVVAERIGTWQFTPGRSALRSLQACRLGYSPLRQGPLNREAGGVVSLFTHFPAERSSWSCLTQAAWTGVRTRSRRRSASR